MGGKGAPGCFHVVGFVWVGGGGGSGVWVCWAGEGGTLEADARMCASRLSYTLIDAGINHSYTIEYTHTCIISPLSN